MRFGGQPSALLAPDESPGKRNPAFLRLFLPSLFPAAGALCSDSQSFAKGLQGRKERKGRKMWHYRFLRHLRHLRHETEEQS